MLGRFLSQTALAAILITTTVLGPVSGLFAADGPEVTPGDGSGDGVSDFVSMLAESNGGPAVANNPRDTADASNDWITDSNKKAKDPMAGLGQVQTDNTCGWSDLDTQLPLEDPAWTGKSPSDGVVKWKSCAVLFPGAPGAPGNLEGRPVEYRFFPNAEGFLPPPPNPAVLAERAYRELHIPAPEIGAGPDRTKLAVNLWTWLWVDNPGPQTVTVTAGGVSVTATATLSSVTWSLGEPATSGDGYQPGPPATLTCQGTGTPPPQNYDWTAQPPCGYRYHWRSLKERTNGTGKWPITATSTWNVTWQSNTGVSGTTSLAATSNDSLEVGEYRTVLVQGPGG